MAGIPASQRDPAFRFWSKVDKESSPNGCWLWTASLSKGYGQFRLGKSLKMAHIWAWESVHGPVQDGLDLDHQCHNRDPECPGGRICVHRRCVNPDHLEPSKRGDNLARGIHHYRVRTHCKHGHEFTEANTYWYRGARLCRACRR